MPTPSLVLDEPNSTWIAREDALVKALHAVRVG